MSKRLIVLGSICWLIISSISLMTLISEKIYPIEQLITSIGVVISLHLISFGFAKRWPRVSLSLDFLLLFATLILMAISLNILPIIFFQRMSEFLMTLNFGLLQLRFHHIAGSLKREQTNRNSPE